MNIIIIANNSNGLFLFRRHLIKALIDLGHRIIVLTPFDTDVERIEKLGATLVNTPMNRRTISFFKEISLFKKYKTELRRINPDLVITYTIKPNIYAGIICRMLKYEYVANITGLGSAFERKGLFRYFITTLYKVALRKSKTVFFENSNNRDIFVKKRIITDCQAHLLNGAGVDIEYFHYLNYPNNSVFHFLFIGRVMKEKGIDELLYATKALIDEGIKCKLVILGELEEDKYRHILNDASLEGWLDYYGCQSDVRPYIEKSDCFVLPSYHEGMANTLLECAASGRPVITSDIPGCREAVISTSGFLCDPRDAESLLVAMKKIIGCSPEKRKQMGMFGRQHMVDFFDKAKVVSDTVSHLID